MPRSSGRRVRRVMNSAKPTFSSRCLTEEVPGIGSITHLATELLMEQAKIKMVHIPYKSGAQTVIPSEVEGVLLSHPRVREAAVTVADQEVGRIGPGLLVLLGFGALLFKRNWPTGIRAPRSAMTSPFSEPVPSGVPLAVQSVSPGTAPASPRAASSPEEQEVWRTAIAEAQKYEAAHDWPAAVAAYVRLQKNFPQKELGRVNLELLLSKLRSEDTVREENFDALRGPLQAALAVRPPPAAVSGHDGLPASLPRRGQRAGAPVHGARPRCGLGD